MKSSRLQKLTSLGLFLAVIVLLGFASVRFSTQFDWTAGGRNTLTEGSQAQLAAMEAPIHFRAFVYSGDPMRRQIEQELGRYLHTKNDIRLEFIDPSTQPQAVREFEIRAPGQIVIEYQGRRETVTGTTEIVVTQALQRLAYGGEQWVVFLSGHGERGIEDGEDALALSAFTESLRSKGLKVQRLNLVESPQIPDNTRVLVIADPQRPYLPGEIELVKGYVERGGNLLWLADPMNPAGLQPLADALGVTWLDGFAVFPEYQLLGTGHPGFFAAINYPTNPVTQGFEQITLFPLVRALTVTPAAGWQQQELLTTSPAAWLETGDLSSGAVELDDNDIPGPLTIGTTLTRQIGEGEEATTQRVALIGDVDFLSNLHIGDLGNADFGLNLVQWLALRDAQLNINVPRAPDTQVYLTPWMSYLFSLGFVVVIPLLLVGIGVGRWLLRRRR